MKPLRPIPTFDKNTIMLPCEPPIVLTGKKEDGNYGFVFRYNEENYYIFATLQGVVNNNLPADLGTEHKALLLDAVNLYCQKSREGLPQNIFLRSQKKTGINPNIA
jgi:hypothetical protein